MARLVQDGKIVEIRGYLEREPLNEMQCGEVDFVTELLEALTHGGEEAFWEIAKRRDYYQDRSSPYEGARPKLIEDALVNLRHAAEQSRKFRLWLLQNDRNLDFQDYKITEQKKPGVLTKEEADSLRKLESKVKSGRK